MSPQTNGLYYDKAYLLFRDKQNNNNNNLVTKQGVRRSKTEDCATD